MYTNLKEFTDWYIEHNHPLKPPAGEPVYETKNNSLNTIIFREGRYQVEYIVVRPNSTFIEAAEKQGVEQSIILLNGEITGYMDSKIVYDSVPFSEIAKEDGTSVLFNMVFSLGTTKLDNVTIGSKGASFLSVQRWDDGIEMNSLAKYKDILI